MSAPMRGKQGKLYVMMLCGIVIILLLLSWARLRAYYDSNSDFGANQNLGKKESFAFDAIRQGERINVFTGMVADRAAARAGDAPQCTETYLSYPLAGRLSCHEDPGAEFLQTMRNELATYPEVTLTDIQFAVTQTGRTIAVSGTKVLPVGVEQHDAASAQTILRGPFTSPPVAGFTLTSAFGNRQLNQRNANGALATRNHPGIDIDVGHSTQTPIQTVIGGTVSVEGTGVNRAVVVSAPALIVKYRHTVPAPGVAVGDTVAAGTIIAYPLYYPSEQSDGSIKDSTHLHLEVQVPVVTNEQAVALLGADHAGPSSQNTKAQSYAVTTQKSPYAYLDPACFFDRDLMSAALQRLGNLSATSFAACDAYEQAFGLSNRLPTPAAPVSVGDDGTRADDTPDTTGFTAPEAVADAPPEVQLTYRRLDQLHLMPLVAEAAQRNGISRELLLAIITQESRGDPNAVSYTGAAGLGQFTSGTAGNYFEGTITPCCTEAELTVVLSCSERKSRTGSCSEWDACFNPTKRNCPASDPRFNPQASIEASAKYLGRIAQKYNGYEQHDALIMAEYNGGGKIKTIVDRSGGKQASWEAISASLPSEFGGQKTTEIRTYVDRVRKWYVAWGGSGFVGTAFSSTQLGYYELRVSAQSEVPVGFAAVLDAADQRVAACTTQDCIRGAVLTTPRPQWVQIDPVRPQDAAGTCATPAEEGQFFIANQIASCADSPDTACGCALDGNADLTLSVTSQSTVLRSVRGQDVTEQLSPSAGLRLDAGPDDDGQTTYVVFAKDTASLARGWPQTGADKDEKDIQTTGTLTLRRGSAPTITIIEPQPFIPDSTHPFASLYKDTQTLVFLGEQQDTCVRAPQPALYCMRDANDPSHRLLFAVDMAAHSTPVNTISGLTVGRIGGGLPSDLFTGIPANTPLLATFTASQSYPALHVLVRTRTNAQRSLLDQTPQETSFEDYMQVLDAAQNPLLDPNAQAVALGSHHGVAVRDGATYSVVFPSAPDSELVLSFIDENLRETAPTVYALP